MKKLINILFVVEMALALVFLTHFYHEECVYNTDEGEVCIYESSIQPLQGKGPEV